MTTKKQWAVALTELTGEAVDPKRFRTAADAQETFEAAAREAGLGWDIVDGTIVFSDGEQEPDQLAVDQADEASHLQQVHDAVRSETTESEDPPAPAEEPAPELPKMERGRPTLEADLDVIEVLAESNPKRAGTATWHRFELYRTGMTVADFLAAGGKRVDLRWDAAHEFVRIVSPEALAAESEKTEQPADAGTIAEADASVE